MVKGGRGKTQIKRVKKGEAGKHREKERKKMKKGGRGKTQGKRGEKRGNNS